MRVTHLRKVELGSPDPERLARFYERDWGLRRVAAEDGAVYLRGAGSEHHILVVRPAPSPAVIGYGLGVADAETVDRVAREVARHRGVVVLSPPSPLGGPGGGYGFVIADVDGRRIELSSDVASAPPLRPERGVEPVKISHVVLNSPNAGQFTEMFVDLLGFRLADEMPHMQFLRCNSDHHSVAIVPAPHASLNHIAFEVPTVDDMLAGVEGMRELGYEVIWGPGRHGPGNNTFGYFLSPNRQVIEYTSEVAQIRDEGEAVPRMWLPEEMRVTDAWADLGSARPTAHARELMLGEAETSVGEPSVLDDDEGSR